MMDERDDDVRLFKNSRIIVCRSSWGKSRKLTGRSPGALLSTWDLEVEIAEHGAEVSRPFVNPATVGSFKLKGLELGFVSSEFVAGVERNWLLVTSLAFFVDNEVFNVRCISNFSVTEFLVCSRNKLVVQFCISLARMVV